MFDFLGSGSLLCFPAFAADSKQMSKGLPFSLSLFHERLQRCSNHQIHLPRRTVGTMVCAKAVVPDTWDLRVKTTQAKRFGVLLHS